MADGHQHVAVNVRESVEEEAKHVGFIEPHGRGNTRYFGLGDAATVDSLRIDWPGGATDVMAGLAADTRYTITEIVPTAVEPAHARALPSLTGSPNPFRGRARLELRLPRASNVTLTVHDVAGRQVVELARGRLAEGLHVFALDAARLPFAGIYLASLECESVTIVRRLVHVR